MVLFRLSHLRKLSEESRRVVASPWTDFHLPQGLYPCPTHHNKNGSGRHFREHYTRGGDKTNLVICRKSPNSKSQWISTVVKCALKWVLI